LSLFDVFITLLKFKHMTIPTTYKNGKQLYNDNGAQRGGTIQGYPPTFRGKVSPCAEKALIPFVRCHLP
jgi:hypothetical protein